MSAGKEIFNTILFISRPFFRILFISVVPQRIAKSVGEKDMSSSQTVTQKPVPGNVRSMARDKEVTPGVQQVYYFFGDYL
jgi:hypothetical protein